MFNGKLKYKIDRLESKIHWQNDKYERLDSRYWELFNDFHNLLVHLKVQVTEEPKSRDIKPIEL